MSPSVPVSQRLRSASFALAVLAVAAFFTRLLPLSFSQYPFNNDALTEVSIASEIMRTGHLDFSNSHWSTAHNIATPSLDVVLAFMASAIGASSVDCGQLLVATISVSTIGVFFLLGRIFSGDTRGAVTAALMGVMFGTFVFTTGSVWKTTLGINLLVLLVLAYIQRVSPRYRALTILILLVIPYVHHLVAAVAILLLAYLLAWSWYFAFATSSFGKKHLLDLATVAVPGAIAVVYYSAVELDRLVQFSSPIRVLLLLLGFALLSSLAILVLSIKRHVEWTFAPLVGAGTTTVILLDYFGLLFPYESSASDSYVLLALASGFIVGLAWYGSEVIIETRAVVRAVQVGLLIAPLTIVVFGIVQGFSLVSHQILYRSFDLLDIFIFVGASVGLGTLQAKHKRLYPLLGSALIAALVISFPFAYWSGELLGVRHDTQAYEMDALAWLDGRDEIVIVITDERISYIAKNAIGILADPSLPQFITPPGQFPEYHWYYVIEDSWTTAGVNYYPNGRFVLPEWEYQLALEASDVHYIGGPSGDRIVIFLASTIGGGTVIV